MQNELVPTYASSVRDEHRLGCAAQSNPISRLGDQGSTWHRFAPGERVCDAEEEPLGGLTASDPVWGLLGTMSLRK